MKSRDVPTIEFATESSDTEGDFTRTEEDFTRAKEDFLKSIDRGGLVTPSELVFLISFHANQLHDEVFTGGEIQKRFLATESQQSSFVELFRRKMENSPSAENIFNQKCNKGHCFLSFVPTITAQFFNCVAKNFAGRLNDEINRTSRKRAPTEGEGFGKDIEKEKDPSARKIKKLQSDC